MNKLNLSEKLWRLGFMHRVNNKQERQEGQDTRQSALKCITVTSASSSEDEEEDEDDTDAVVETRDREVEDHVERGERDDEEMEEGELPESHESREVVYDDHDVLVVKRDLRETREADEAAVWVGEETEAEIRDGDRGGDEDEVFLFDESQLEFDEFNDSTRYHLNFMLLSVLSVSFIHLQCRFSFIVAGRLVAFI